MWMNTSSGSLTIRSRMCPSFTLSGAFCRKSGNGIEIGVGTGRFAAPLGVKRGIEPSRPMAELARKKGVEVTSGVAEKLPFGDGEFDFALMVTTVCFLDDMDLAFHEVHRVLRPGGPFLIGFIDRESPLGREYSESARTKARFTRMRPSIRSTRS